MPKQNTACSCRSPLCPSEILLSSDVSSSPICHKSIDTTKLLRLDFLPTGKEIHSRPDSEECDMISDKRDPLDQVKIELLIVGNELLNGTTLDTNSHWLAKRFVREGVLLTRKTTIRDDLSTISAAFRECLKRTPDWVISVGGLGPTYDDMTVEGLSLALRKRMLLNPEAFKMLKESYARRRKMFKVSSRRLSKASKKMAVLPESAVPLRNSVGSAPGVLATSGKTRLVALPGVPSEMKAIFKESIEPALASAARKISHAEEWIEAVGISESRLSAAVSKVSKKHSPLLYIKSHPMGFEKGRSVIRIQIILTSSFAEREKSLVLLERVAKQMEESARKLGAHVARIKSVR